MKNLLKKYDPVIEKAEFLFELLFFVYICLGFNNLTIGSKIIPFFMWPTFLLGAALFGLRLLDWRSCRSIPGALPLLGLCAVSAVSILVNREYGLKENLVYLIFWVFYFFLLYVSPDRRPAALLQKRFTFFFHLFCAVAFVLTLISFVMFATRYGGYFKVNGELVRRGYMDGRLFGAYQTPNAGAVIGALVSVGVVHYARMYKNKWYTLWATVNVLMHFVFAVLSDSRTGRATLAAAFGVYVFFVIGRQWGDGSRRMCRLPRWTVAVFCAVLVTSAAYFLPKAAEYGYNAAVKSIGTSDTQDAADAEETKDKKKDDVLILGRKYSVEDDYSNGRLKYWRSGLEIFAARPVLGVTFRGFLPFAKEHLPDTAVSKTGKLQVTTLDNDVINLMVSNGAAGLLCFLCFVFAVCLRLVRRLIAFRKEGRPLPAALPLLLAVVAGAAVSSLFSSGVLYMHCQYSFLFWMALGLLPSVEGGGHA